jgi:AcrR family transcriptional regulator
VTTTRDRILDATSELFRRQGYTGTGVKQIVAAASAPFGSVYHHFPGGKEQLGEEVIRFSGAMYGRLIGAFYDPAPDPVTATRNFFAAAAETLRQTDYADACPIATIALEVASTSEPLRQATHDVFEGWLAECAQRMEAHGVAPAKAREVAIALVALLEGAFLLSRAAKSTEAMAVTGEAAAGLVGAALVEAALVEAARPRPKPRKPARHRP